MADTTDAAAAAASAGAGARPERLTPPAPEAGRGRRSLPTGAAVGSFALHIGAAMLLMGVASLFRERSPPPPDVPASVDVITGTNAQKTGKPAQPAARAAPPPAPDAPQQQQAAGQPAPAPPTPAPPASPTAQQTAEAAAAPPPVLASPAGGDDAVPPPKPLPPSPAATARQAAEASAPRASSTPQARQTRPRPSQSSAQAARPAPPTPPDQTPPQPDDEPPLPAEVNVGDGIAIAAAKIEDTGTIHPAKGDVGNIPPSYPAEAARRGEQGTVVLRVSIRPDGYVGKVVIVSSSGSFALDQSARERIATWHFHPATRDGKPVAVDEIQVVRFAAN